MVIGDATTQRLAAPSRAWADRALWPEPRRARGRGCFHKKYIDQRLVSTGEKGVAARSLAPRERGRRFHRGSELELAERVQVLEGLNQARGHALLAEVQPGARVDVLLVGLVVALGVAELRLAGRRSSRPCTS